MATEENAILFLEKNALYYFDGSKVAKLDFAKEFVADFDIVNEELLIKSIFQFIDSQKLVQSKFITVLSESALFINDFKETDPVKIESQFVSFTNTVPYNQVISKKYSLQDGVRMVATNEDLVTVIDEAFVQKGFIKDVVVPAMVFGRMGDKVGLTVEDANFMLKNQHMADGKSMVDRVVALPQPVSDTFKITKGKSTMLPMLLGVFGLMVVGLVLLLIFRK